MSSMRFVRLSFIARSLFAPFNVYPISTSRSNRFSLVFSSRKKKEQSRNSDGFCSLWFNRWNEKNLDENQGTPSRFEQMFNVAIAFLDRFSSSWFVFSAWLTSELNFQSLIKTSDERRFLLNAKQQRWIAIKSIDQQISITKRTNLNKIFIGRVRNGKHLWEERRSTN